MANLKTAKDDFTAKMAAAETGGIADTAARNNSRQTLIGHLRQVAAYVQIACNNDMALVLSSGFQAQSTNRASTPLEQSQSLSIKNGGCVNWSQRSIRSATRTCTKGASSQVTATGCRASLPATRNTSTSKA